MRRELLLDNERTCSVQKLFSKDCRRESLPQNQGFMRQIYNLRGSKSVSGTTEAPSQIHNPLSPIRSKYPGATVQTESSLPNLKHKSTHNKVTQSISEKRCSQTPFSASHTLGMATNWVRAQKSKKVDENKLGGQSLHILSPQNRNCFSRQSCTFLPNSPC